MLFLQIIMAGAGYTKKLLASKSALCPHNSAPKARPRKIGSEQIGVKPAFTRA